MKSTANNSELMKQIEALSEAVANLASSNKATSNYFHDTGCTPTSFVKVKPPDFKGKLGMVSTAGGDSFRTLGTGSVKFGSLSTQVTYCPDFAKNLISGIAINNQGLHQTIGNNHLVVYNGVLDEKTIPVATGKINTDVGLIEMDLEVNPLAVPIILNTNKALVSFQGKSWNEIHESLGHCGDSMMRRSSDKIPVKPTTGCEDCSIGKMRRPNIRKSTESKHSTLDKVSLDFQGPFRKASHEGCTYNLKIIDNASSFVKVEWLSSKESSQATACFQRFQSRIERKTGKKIKVVQTDEREM